MELHERVKKALQDARTISSDDIANLGWKRGSGGAYGKSRHFPNDKSTSVWYEHGDVYDKENPGWKISVSRSIVYGAPRASISVRFSLTDFKMVYDTRNHEFTKNEPGWEPIAEQFCDVVEGYHA
ncbi:TPA: hypothetical protein HA278_07940 [Candidatus Woesearchaeota archaeon]|nr:hypothetical protein [archaeon]HIJ11963.1 hypothetical protein [Candidatus Woesearchaeota archaeon]